MELFYKATAPEVPVHIISYITGPDGKFIKHTYGWRTGFITKSIDKMESVELTFPLINADIPAGSTLNIFFSTRNERLFYRYPEIRENFKPQDEGVIDPSITLFQGENQQSLIHIPIEQSI